ncbi:hypothetical protein REPUB_Repub10bG0004000 [Reevesia pubescens]
MFSFFPCFFFFFYNLLLLFIFFFFKLLLLCSIFWTYLRTLQTLLFLCGSDLTVLELEDLSALQSSTPLDPPKPPPPFHLYHKTVAEP